MYEMEWFPGDDLLSPLRPRGLPIGNLTSQTWANVYLDSLDQFVKRELSCRAYVRYCDDFLFFHDDKEQLHAWKEAVQSHLDGLRLNLNLRRSAVYPTRTGIPFLGFRVFPTHRRLRADNVRRACATLARQPGCLRAGRLSAGRASRVAASLDRLCQPWRHLPPAAGHAAGDRSVIPRARRRRRCLPSTLTCWSGWRHALESFPKAQRFLLASRLMDTAFACHAELIRARKVTDAARAQALLRADVELETLRLQWRLAHELSCISTGQYEHGARLMDEVGRLLGAWRKRGCRYKQSLG